MRKHTEKNDVLLKDSKEHIASSSGNELIPFEFIDKKILIDAEWLHLNLEVATPKHIWIKRKIKELSLIKNFDYYSTQVNSNDKNQNIRDNSKRAYYLTHFAAIVLITSEQGVKGIALRKKFIATITQFMIEKDPFKGLNAVSRKVKGKMVEYYPISKVRVNLGMGKINSITKLYEKLPDDFWFDGEIWMASKMYCLVMAHRKTGSNIYKECTKAPKQLPINFEEKQLKIEFNNNLIEKEISHES